MTTSIAEYYSTELDDWKETIDFNLEKIDEVHEGLDEILRFNTVTNLAGKVEHHLNALLLCKQNFADLYSKINAFEKKIYNGQAPVANELITGAIKDQQQQLRKEMYETEMDYISVKSDCANFLADTIYAQNIKHTNHSPH
jgi:hypothetical protein